MTVFVDFDEAKAKISLPEVTEILGIADQFQSTNGMLRGVCPMPSHQHNPVKPNPNQFTIRKIDGVWMWKCWGDCKAAGTVITFLERFLKISPAHVRLWLHEHFANRLNAKPRTGRGAEKRVRDGTEKKAARPVVETPERAKAHQSNDTIPGEPAAYKPIRFTLQTDPDAEYLKQRGLTEETISQFQLGLCGRGMLKGYVAIPVWEHPRGQHPYGYLGRWAGEDYDEGDGRPRYKWPAGFPMSRFVYGIEEALESEPRRPLIVVEGVFKLYHLRQNGFPNTVAVFGSSLSDDQARQLAETGRDIVLMFDGTEDGLEGMRKATAKLIEHTWVRAIALDDGVEPDHLSATELAETLSFTQTCGN